MIQPLRRWFLPALMLVCSVTLMACAGKSVRPQPAALPEYVDLIGVQQVWQTQLGRVRFPLQVQVVGERVYLASSQGSLVTLDAGSGRELERVELDERLTAGVGSDGQRQAVITRKNELVVVQSGAELWRVRLGTQSHTAPLVAGGRVFVLGADRSLAAYDARGGAQLWQIERPSEPLVLQESGVLLPVGNTLVAGFSGRLAGVDPDYGDILWEAPVASSRGTNDIESLIDLVAPASRQGQLVCARAFEAGLGCVDTSSSQILWTARAKGKTGLATDGQLVYGTESDGQIVAWNLHDGEPAWKNQQFKWRELTAPLVLGRSVVMGDAQGRIHMLSREDGQVLDRLETGGSAIAATPVAAANTLVVVTRAGQVLGFRPQ